MKFIKLTAGALTLVLCVIIACIVKHRLIMTELLIEIKLEVWISVNMFPVNATVKYWRNQEYDMLSDLFYG